MPPLRRRAHDPAPGRKPLPRVESTARTEPVRARRCGSAGVLPLAPVLALALTACTDEYDSGGRCPEYEPVPATPVAVVDIAGVDPLVRGPRSLFGDGGRYEPTTEDESVIASDLLLSITPITTPAAVEGARSRLTRRLSCVGPPGPSVESTTRLIDITLTSDARWDASQPAGSALEGVTVVDAASVLPLGLDELPDHLDSRRFGTVLQGASLDVGSAPRLADYLRGAPSVPLGLLLRLDPPDAERRHRFTVTYRTEDGETFTATSVPITVVPRRPPPSVDDLDGTAWRLRGYSIRTASGTLAERVWGDGGISGIEFDGRLSQMVVSVEAYRACEFNIRVADGELELRGMDPTTPYDPDSRTCRFDAGEPTEERRFLERFLASASYALAIDEAERLTVTAPGGERLVLGVVL